MGRLRTIKEASTWIKASDLLINNFQTLSKSKKKIYLEIGSGNGDFLINHAINNPKNIYVGIEKFATVIWKAVKKIESLDSKPKNIFFINADAYKVLEEEKNVDLKKYI